MKLACERILKVLVAKERQGQPRSNQKDAKFFSAILRSYLQVASVPDASRIDDRPYFEVEAAAATAAAEAANAPTPEQLAAEQAARDRAELRARLDAEVIALMQPLPKEKPRLFEQEPNPQQFDSTEELDVANLLDGMTRSNIAEMFAELSAEEDVDFKDWLVR